MTDAKSAVVRAERPTVPGIPFIDAAGKLCVWPISGAGADMTVCGAAREPGRSYCQEHRKKSGGG